MVRVGPLFKYGLNCTLKEMPLGCYESLSVSLLNPLYWMIHLSRQETNQPLNGKLHALNYMIL